MLVKNYDVVNGKFLNNSCGFELVIVGINFFFFFVENREEWKFFISEFFFKKYGKSSKDLLKRIR